MKPCFLCGTPAPYGYGFPGKRSDLPPSKRGYLWACHEHREDAEARRAKAVQG